MRGYVGVMNEIGDTKNSISTRNAYFDNVKFVMIVLMVVGHFVDAFTASSDMCKSAYMFIYSFHMPVFLFISGLFYRMKDTRKKVLFYSFIGFATKMYLALCCILCKQKTGFFLLSDVGVPWFMFVLAIYQILMWLFRDVHKIGLLIFSIILACFTGFDNSIRDYLYLSRVVVFFPFYLLGTMISSEQFSNFKKKRSLILMPMVILIIGCALYLSVYKLDSLYKFRHLLTGKNPFSDQILKYGILARFVCYAVSALVGFSVMLCIPSRRIPMISKMGTKTLNAYFWHYGILLFLLKYTSVEKVFCASKTGKIAFLGIAVILSIVLMIIPLFDYPCKAIKKMCFTKQKD